ncbi:MAG: DUF1804 family protein [Candidatus Brocadiaceae bacterium]|jgi:transposase-like protein
MTTHSREKNDEEVRARARDLYFQNSTLDAIARSLEVSVMSLLRWRRDARLAGRPWRRANEPEPEEEMRRKLREVLMRLVDEAHEREGDRPQEHPCLEDRMLKICRVLEHVRPDAEDLTAQLKGLKRFAGWCLRNLREDQMGPVRHAVRRFVDEMREEHS